VFGPLFKKSSQGSSPSKEKKKFSSQHFKKKIGFKKRKKRLRA
jgi:hypothetical protein